MILKSVSLSIADYTIKIHTSKEDVIVVPLNGIPNSITLDLKFNTQSEADVFAQATEGQPSCKVNITVG